MKDSRPTLPTHCPMNETKSSIGTQRRSFLKIGAAATITLLPAAVHAADDDDPKAKMRPQAGDILVRADSDPPSTVIAAADVKMGDPPLLAWAMDPVHKVVRDGSRLNQVLLLRLDPSILGPQTKPHAIEGLVAYSAICTHAQCTVTGWLPDKQVLHCPCHQSEYDPRHDAIVVSGPAPRSLAALPLAVADGKLEVAGPFIGKVGMTQPTM